MDWKHKFERTFAVDALNGNVESLPSAFVFHETEEGHVYWAEFAYRGKPLTEEAKDKITNMIAEYDAWLASNA